MPEPALHSALEYGFYLPPSFGFAAVCIPLAIGVVVRGLRHGKRPIEAAVLLALSGYLGALAAVTLFPVPVGMDEVTRRMCQEEWSLYPLRSVISAWREGPYALVGYAFADGLILMPLGYLAPIVWARLRGLVRAAAFGAACSVGIELSQVMVSWAVGYRYRTVDVDDALLGLAGFLVGYTLYRLLARRLAEAGLVTEAESGRDERAGV